MDPAQFEHLKAQVVAASAEQTLELDDLIQRLISRKVAEIALARRKGQTLGARTCLHCASNDVLRHGNDQNGRQRFKCRACRKTFNILTGTPMARARMPEKWGTYLGCMTEQMTVREIVASGIGVNHVTAWRWRRRFLKATTNDNAAALPGEIDGDTAFFQRPIKAGRALDKAKLCRAVRLARTQAMPRTAECRANKFRRHAG